MIDFPPPSTVYRIRNVLYVKSVHKKWDVIKILGYWTHVSVCVSICIMFFFLFYFIFFSFFFFAATLQNNFKWFALKNAVPPSPPSSGFNITLYTVLHCEIFCIWYTLVFYSVFHSVHCGGKKEKKYTADTVFLIVVTAVPLICSLFFLLSQHSELSIMLSLQCKHALPVVSCTDAECFVKKQ